MSYHPAIKRNEIKTFVYMYTRISMIFKISGFVILPNSYNRKILHFLNKLAILIDRPFTVE